MSDYHVNNPDNLTVAEAYAKGWDDAVAEVSAATLKLAVEQDKPADLKIAEAIFGTERLKELGIS